MQLNHDSESSVSALMNLAAQYATIIVIESTSSARVLLSWSSEPNANTPATALGRVLLIRNMIWHIFAAELDVLPMTTPPLSLALVILCRQTR